MVDLLIPPSIADDRMRALASLLDRLDALPVAILDNLYDPDLCHEAALPFLAHQFGVLDAAWTLAATTPARRNLVKQAIQLQKRRGTPWAMKQALAAIGWPGMEIIERSSHWAQFKVVQPLQGRAVPQAELDRLLPTIEAWKPARCVLESIEFGVTFASDVNATGPRHDGAYTHNAAIKYEGLTLANIAYAKVGAGTPTVQINAPVVVDQGPNLLITFLVDSAAANGVAVDTYAIYSAAHTEIARATAPPVAKNASITLAVQWTLNKI